MVGVEQWAEIRRLHFVKGLSQREIRRRTGLHRDTIRRAISAEVAVHLPTICMPLVSMMRRSPSLAVNWTIPGAMARAPLSTGAHVTVPLAATAVTACPALQVPVTRA